MKIIEIKGNLIDRFVIGLEPIIAHGCNCFNTMKSGFAKSLVGVFPRASEVDFLTEKGDRGKLGGFSVASDMDRTAYNLYTQYTYSRTSQVVEWDKVEKSLLSAIECELQYTKRIAIPLIGCGLAGGKEEDLLKVISNISDRISEEFTLVIYRN